MMSSAPDAGQGTGIAGFLFLIFLPLPGRMVRWPRDRVDLVVLTPASSLVDNLPAPRLQGMRHTGFCAHRAELT